MTSLTIKLIFMLSMEFCFIIFKLTNWYGRLMHSWWNETFNNCTVFFVTATSSLPAALLPDQEMWWWGVYSVYHHLKWGHLSNRDTSSGPNSIEACTYHPLKWGHLSNRDSYIHSVLLSVTHFRVQQLTELAKHVDSSRGAEAGLSALFTLYHSYCPHMVGRTQLSRKRVSWNPIVWVTLALAGFNLDMSD